MAPAIPIIAVAATVISAGVAAYSAYEQGQASSRNANYQSAVAARNAQANQQNAEFARQNANYARVQANEQEANAARRVRQIAATQTATAAAQGLNVNEGSALDLRESSERIGQINIRNARAQGDRNVEGFERQRANFLAAADTGSIQAMGLSSAADSYSRAGMIGAGSALVSGVASAGGRYYDMQRSGAYNGGISVNGVGGSPDYEGYSWSQTV